MNPSAVFMQEASATQSATPEHSSISVDGSNKFVAIMYCIVIGKLRDSFNNNKRIQKLIKNPQ